MSIHETSLEAVWNGTFNGRGTVNSPGFATPVSLPKEFGGLGEGASPEDLLLSSVSSCYLITFGIILNKANVSYQKLSVNGKLLTKMGAAASVEEVILTVKVKTDTPQTKLEELAERVNGFCLISKALKDTVKKTVQIIQENVSDLREVEAQN